MTSPRMYRLPAEDSRPSRPSHFEEEPQQRTVEVVEDYAVTGEPDPEIIPPPLDPYPVFLVAAPPKDPVYRKSSTSQVTVTNKAQQLVGMDRRRVRVVVQNTSADKTVYLTTDEAHAPFIGYPLPPGKDVELTDNCQWWASCIGSDTAIIGWLWEWEL